MQEKSVKSQFIAAFVVNLLTITCGLMEGWTSPSIALLTSDASPFASGEITMEEASWVASMYYIGSLVGCICSNLITNRFGPKIHLLLMVPPLIVNWTLILLAQDVYYLYAARFLGGLLIGSAYLVMVLLLSEIANESVRGTLISSIVLTEMAGILLASIVGNFLDFYAIPKLAIAITIIFAAVFPFIPESPLFLMKHNKILRAEKSIEFYKNVCTTANNRKNLDKEMEKLKYLLSQVRTESTHKTPFDWRYITHGVGRKAMIIGMILVSNNTFCGVFAMTNYTASIFQETGSNLSPNMSTIVVGSLQLIASCTLTRIADRFGRRLLLVVSNVGTALGLIVLGVYVMLKSYGIEVESFNYIPLISFSFTNFISLLGVQSLTHTIVAEIMPSQIKEFGLSFCMSHLYIFMFSCVKLQPTLIDLIGFPSSMFCFAGVCLSCALLAIFYIPETRGKTHDEIMKSLE